MDAAPTRAEGARTAPQQRVEEDRVCPLRASLRVQDSARTKPARKQRPKKADPNSGAPPAHRRLSSWTPLPSHTHYQISCTPNPAFRITEHGIRNTHYVSLITEHGPRFNAPTLQRSNAP